MASMLRLMFSLLVIFGSTEAFGQNSGITVEANASSGSTYYRAEGLPLSTNHAPGGLPDFNFQERRVIEPGVAPGYTIGTTEHYGLWIQRVTFIAEAGPCLCQPGEYFSEFETYYEYAWILKPAGLGATSPDDVFGTGTWSTASHGWGWIYKLGEAKLIPVDPAKYKAWKKGLGPKPDAIALFEQFEADPNWNRTPNAEGQVEVPESEATPSGDPLTSGTAPNRPDQPAGWNHPNAISFWRDLYVEWDFCGDYCDVSETAEEEESENGDDSDGDQGGQ